MKTAAMVLAIPNACVPWAGDRSTAATLRKKIGKTAVEITVCIDDTAQSYIAQARSSRRCRPNAFRIPRDVGGAIAMMSLVIGGQPRQIIVCVHQGPVQHVT